MQVAFPNPGSQYLVLKELEMCVSFRTVLDFLEFQVALVLRPAAIWRSRESIRARGGTRQGGT